MGLINLQTNLKSLRFGNDRVHGGSSKQPYIQTPIPENSGGFGVLDTDFILRGGSKAIVNSIKDVERLGKYFTDVRNPSGLLFVAKQNLLSRTAVRTQASGILNEGIYTPISTLLEAGGVAFGLHVNKQGLNPFDGLGSIGKYNNVVTQFQPNNQNRLVNIYNDKQDQPSFTLSLDPVNVRTYTGGPNSILGIGKTNIRFADQRTGEASGHSPKYLFGFPNGNGAIGSDTDRTDIPLDYRNALGLSKNLKPSSFESDYFNDIIENISTNTGISSDGLGNGYFLGQNSNITIGQIGKDEAKTYLVGLPNGNGARWGNTDRTDISLNYRNALGLSVSSSYNAKNNVNLGDAKYSGVNSSGEGFKYFIGQDSNISINNIITGDDLKNYQSGLKNSETYRDYSTPKTLDPTANLYPQNVVTYTQKDIEDIPTNTISKGESTLTGKNGSTNVTGDFRALLRNNNRVGSDLLGLAALAPNYTTKNIEQRVLLGTPGDTKFKNLLSYTNGSRTGAIYGNSGGNASINSYDKINALPIYFDNTPDDVNGNDLVKFRIGVISNDDPTAKTYIHFRAFLNQITDQYSSEWSDTKYIGRGEKFYTYSGFDRKVSLSWTVAAQSKAELIPMYKKLNYLASICAPDYSAAGYMRGNIVTLTIGGYFYEQPGIITGFSYDMNDDNSTWEIGINDEAGSDNTVKELPHLIKVSGFNFIPIHTFVPRKQQMSYDPQGDILTDANGYGPERYIALANGFGNNENNYGPVYVNPVPEQPPPLPKQDPTPSTNGQSSKDPVPQKLPPQQKSNQVTGSVEFGGGTFGGAGAGGTW